MHGTPTDAVLVTLDTSYGILAHLGLAPLLLVAGPNKGINVSGDIAYSGTVNAARQAGYAGVPAISTCFSQKTPEDQVFAIEATMQLIGACLETLGEGIPPRWS